MNSVTKQSSRLTSVDALRGAVMIIMALDHVRDFFHAGAMTFSPTDLTRTTPILFFTRWITHFCLPVFMFTAGMGAYLWRQRNHTDPELTRFLWTRGVWLIVLELTVMQVAYNFSFSFRFLLLLLILWIFGACMIAMSALVYLSPVWLAAFGLVVIGLHNCLDGIAASQFGSAGWIWNLLHQPGVIAIPGGAMLVSYTLLPWVGVMAAGFCFAQIFSYGSLERQRMMLRIGWAAILGFIVLRGLNGYGDPTPWARQTSFILTVLSFLNCTKYPASLDFLLMTLGPALVILAYLDRRSFKPANPLVVFGRVPLFYFVLHFYLIHLLAGITAYLRYGQIAFTFLFNPLPSMGGPKKLFPPAFGYSLWIVYGVWIFAVVALYPLCRWFAKVKATRQSWWLSYL